MGDDTENQVGEDPWPCPLRFVRRRVEDNGVHSIRRILQVELPQGWVDVPEVAEDGGDR